MESGSDVPRPSSEAERRARLQELAYGSGSSPEQMARARAALDAIEQEDRALIRARARASDTSLPEGRREGWELREADVDDVDESPLARRRPVVVLVALLTAVAVGLTAIGAGISLFF